MTHCERAGKLLRKVLREALAIAFQDAAAHTGRILARTAKLVGAGGRIVAEPNFSDHSVLLPSRSFDLPDLFNADFSL